MAVNTLIHDLLIEAGRSDLVRRYGLEPVRIPVLCVERTLCEKVMVLVRAGHAADRLAELRRRIRHLYDIVMIMRSSEYREFVNSNGFVEMVAEVRDWDRRSIAGASEWLNPPLQEAMIVADAENLWSELRSEFRGSFKEMVYGNSVPDDDEVLACLASIGASLRRV